MTVCSVFANVELLAANFRIFRLTIQRQTGFYEGTTFTYWINRLLRKVYGLIQPVRLKTAELARYCCLID